MSPPSAPPPNPTSSLFSVEEPLNREPATKQLLSQHLTSASEAYDRNHGPIPRLDAETHSVSLSDTTRHKLLSTSWAAGKPNQPNAPPQDKGLDTSYNGHLEPSSQHFTLSDLQANFTEATITCALQCAGNRRHTMRSKLGQVSGIDWFEGAVMNCTWTGVRLSDVLERAFGGAEHTSTISSDILSSTHVAFACHATPTQDDSWYGSSIRLGHALDREADVLLAWAQNGHTLTPEHGFPLRLIVPGVAGARSVKWLDAITVQEDECQNFYMQRDYKVLPSQVKDQDAADQWWSRVGPLMDMPINSVVVAWSEGGETGKEGNDEGEDQEDVPRRVLRDEEGQIEVRGYALPAGSGGPVVTVDIRIDDGNWQAAELLHQDETISKWSWVLWRWKGCVEPGRHTVWSRAVDAAGHRQEHERSQWNWRGVAYNGYGELEMDVV